MKLPHNEYEDIPRSHIYILLVLCIAVAINVVGMCHAITQ